MDKQITRLCSQYGVSADRLNEILTLINSSSSLQPQLTDITFPEADDKRIQRSWKSFSCSVQQADEAIARTGCSLSLKTISEPRNGRYSFSSKQLRTIGLHLLPFTAYGILNGGSATSYIDRKKNSAFNPELYKALSKPFEKMNKYSAGKTKSCTPAYLNSDLSAGYSFIELKLRNILLLVKEYTECIGKFPSRGLPVFQMTSAKNTSEVLEFQERIKTSPLLGDLIRSTGYDPFPLLTATQPLLAAITPASAGKNRSVYVYSENGKNRILPLPGGHGESFNTLKGIYKKMYSDGIRLAYLGNSDNLGNTIEPAELAIMALSAAPAGFEFSLKTAVDIKGGVLVCTENRKLSCADMGAGISADEVNHAENKNIPILFNCATGIFNLEYLTAHIDYIRNNIPIRISEQDKDIGKYAQAEQVTWEVLQLIDNPLIFQVDKYERFLASKLLLENLLTSGWAETYIAANNAGPLLSAAADKLQSAFAAKMRNEYKMAIKNGIWQIA